MTMEWAGCGASSGGATVAIGAGSGEGHVRATSLSRNNFVGLVDFIKM
jgi:hypothetical protein